jgi:hypothetical protein
VQGFWAFLAKSQKNSSESFNFVFTIHSVGKSNLATTLSSRNNLTLFAGRCYAATITQRSEPPNNLAPSIVVERKCTYSWLLSKHT